MARDAPSSPGAVDISIAILLCLDRDDIDDLRALDSENDKSSPGKEIFCSESGLTKEFTLDLFDLGIGTDGLLGDWRESTDTFLGREIGSEPDRIGEEGTLCEDGTLSDGMIFSPWVLSAFDEDAGTAMSDRSARSVVLFSLLDMIFCYANPTRSLNGK